MGWITVAIIVGSLLVAAILLVRKGARRWWDCVVIFVLTVALVQPLYAVTGDASRWLRGDFFWSDGIAAKDQISVVSMASMLLLPLVLAAGVLCVARSVIDYVRANRDRRRSD